MSKTAHTLNEQAAAEAFSRQAPLFDNLYSEDLTVQYKRKRVREHVLQYLDPGSSVLELNAGTGEDTVFFAQQGYTVHATDISAAMQEKLKEKTLQHKLQMLISNEICSFTELEKLSARGPYDLIFSNFAGLNCTSELSKVLHSFDRLVKPDGLVTLVILPRFCLWELLLVFKGKFKTAFRRFSGSKGAKAHIEGQYFRCWYYNPSFIKKEMKGSFHTISIEGLCTLVPPSYIEKFAESHPRSFSFLTNLENKWRRKWPWRSIGDYYIITLRKKS
ncbi:MAG: methyltransferase domain-containing protein [Chitinophagaceae bacterium]|nr:methyltransferase domain-containing protein [Chitinophagaceae bacterium]